MNDLPYHIFRFIFLFSVFIGLGFRNKKAKIIFSYIAAFCLGAEVMFLIMLLI